MKAASFFKGLSTLIVLNLLVKPVWMFFIDRQVQNTVGHEAYGRYFAVLNLSYVLFFLSDAGLSNMINQRLAAGERLHIPQLFRLKVVMMAIYIVLCLFIGWLTGITQWTYLIYVLLIQVFTSLFVMARNMVTGYQLFTTDAWLSVIDKTLMTLICGAILYTQFFGSMDLDLFLQVQAFCTAVAAGVAFTVLSRRKIFTKGKFLQLEVLLRSILPFALIILLMSVHYRLDGFMLERLHYRGAEEAGIYASAYRLLDASNMVGYLSSAFLISFIARHLSDRAFIDQAIVNTRHGLFFFVTGVVSFTCMYAPWLQQLLYHSDDPYQREVIRYCIASLPGYFLVHIYGAVLTAARKFRPYLVLLLLSVLINTILNLILIPRYGAIGCCYAAMASQYFCGLACLLVAHRYEGLHLHYRSLLVYVCLAVLLVGFFYFAEGAGINVWLTGAIAAAFTLLLLTTQIKKKYFISLR